MSSPMEHISWGGTGQRTVGTSAVALTASETAGKRVMIKALPGNAGVVYVGDSNAVASSTGYPISASEETPWIDVPGNDLQNVYLIASQASQGVAWTLDKQMKLHLPNVKDAVRTAVTAEKAKYVKKVARASLAGAGGFVQRFSESWRQPEVYEK